MSELLKRPNVAIIDYGMGNLFSISRACEMSGINACITAQAKMIHAADAVILPGVGAFGSAMAQLNGLDLVSPIRDIVAKGMPFLGICLGMQLLFEESEEFGQHKGLGIIRGLVRRFPKVSSSGARIKVPQVGWNQINKSSGKEWDDTLLCDVPDEAYMYFVHSYYCVPADPVTTLSTTSYGGIQYCSSLHYGNVRAFQFHPEKSAARGLSIYVALSALAQSCKKGNNG
jgi:glutamine amidotransferase